jgi:hypothetical protein
METFDWVSKIKYKSQIKKILSYRNNRISKKTPCKKFQKYNNKTMINTWFTKTTGLKKINYIQLKNKIIYTLIIWCRLYSYFRRFASSLSECSGRSKSLTESVITDDDVRRNLLVNTNVARNLFNHIQIYKLMS